MSRAIRLAEKGVGWTRPNPLVGAVIVKDGRIIGEGYHAYFGGPHAEAAAFDACIADPSGATVYVTMEPCSHTGKTPPCAKLLIEKKVARVVAAMTDPNPQVNGRGLKMLRDAGITVESGLLEEKVRRQNEIFIKYITTGEPFVILKTAMTLDGKIATVSNAYRWITGEQSRRRVHKMRMQVAAVMTGIGTVLADDPQLNVRLKKKVLRQPLKVILDSGLRIPLTAALMRQDPQLTLIATTARAPEEKILALERLGVQVLAFPEHQGRVDLKSVIRALGAMEIDSVMIEGGSGMAFSALEAGVVDKVTAFIAPKILGGNTAPTPVGGEGRERMEDAFGLTGLEIRRLGEDFVIEGMIKK